MVDEDLYHLAEKVSVFFSGDEVLGQDLNLRHQSFFDLLFQWGQTLRLRVQGMLHTKMSLKRAKNEHPFHRYRPSTS